MSNPLTRKRGPETIKKAALLAIRANRPVFIWGPPGIGKSDLVRSIAHDLSARIIDVRLSLWDPTDIKGMPYFNPTSQKMEWAPPAELPDHIMAEKHPCVVLFLDELTSAALSVQAAAYQLILDRKIGTYSLPDNVIIMAAGNNDGDRGVTYRMPTPLANRFLHLEMTVIWDDWYNWAIAHGIHKDVLGFLSFDKKSLHDFSPTSNEKAFATPRTWTFVSDILNAYDGTDHDVLDTLIAGTVGEGKALAFAGFRQLSGSLPSTDDILNGRVKTLETDNMSAKYALITNLVHALKESSENDERIFLRQMDHYLRFNINNFDPELAVLGLRTLTRNYGVSFDIDELNNYDDFFLKFGKYTTAYARVR